MNKKNPPREPGGSCLRKIFYGNEKPPRDRLLIAKIVIFLHFNKIFLRKHYEIKIILLPTKIILPSTTSCYDCSVLFQRVRRVFSIFSIGMPRSTASFSATMSEAALRLPASYRMLSLGPRRVLISELHSNSS